MIQVKGIPWSRRFPDVGPAIRTTALCAAAYAAGPKRGEIAGVVLAAALVVCLQVTVVLMRAAAERLGG